MTLLLPTLSVAFAAFCVWLTVRIVNRKERWAKWTLAAVLIGLPALYVASFGPACWWCSTRLSKWIAAGAWEGTDPLCAPSIYWPIGWVAENGPAPVGDAVFWYAQTGLGESNHIMLPIDRSGKSWNDSMVHDLNLFLRL